MSREAHDAAQALVDAADDGVAEVCSALGIDLMVMFGSAVDGDDPEDVDVAVQFERGARADVLGLLDELYQLTGFAADRPPTSPTRIACRSRSCVGRP